MVLSLRLVCIFPSLMTFPVPRLFIPLKLILIVNNNQEWLVAGHQSGTLVVWHVPSLKPLNILPLHQCAIEYITFLDGPSDSHTIITADLNGYIKLVKFEMSFFLREWEAEVSIILAATAGPIKVLYFMLFLFLIPSLYLHVFYN